MVISASLQACGVVFPFAMLISICRSIVTICSGLYLLIGMTRFSSKWILSHSTWYKSRRSGRSLVQYSAFVPILRTNHDGRYARSVDADPPRHRNSLEPCKDRETKELFRVWYFSGDSNFEY